MGSQIANHPTVRRIRRNLARVGQPATEIYRIKGDASKGHVYFDVFSMREWAAAHVEPVSMLFDWGRAKRLVESGAIDPDRIKNHTILSLPAPIIVGRHAAGPNNDQILDGAHRYVALAVSAAMNGMEGAPFPVATHLLEPDQWRRFVIPTFVAEALHFDAKFDGGDQ